MLKIVIFTDTISESSEIGHCALQLARTLAQQQYRVILLTGESERKYELEELPNNLEVLYPFRRWSLLELPAVAMLLSQIAPDIIHSFQPSRRHGFFSAYHLASDLADFYRRPLKMFTQLRFDQRRLSFANLQLMQKADMITVPSASVRLQICKIFPDFHSRIQPMPLPIQKLTNPLEIDISVADENFHTIIIPGSVSDLIDPDQVLEKIRQTLKIKSNLQFIFTGDWGQYSSYRRNIFWQKIFRDGSGVRLRFLAQSNSRIQITKGYAYYWLGTLTDSISNSSRRLQTALDMGMLPIFNKSLLLELVPKWNSELIATCCLSKNYDLVEILNQFEKPGQMYAKTLASLKQGFTQTTQDDPTNALSRLYHQMLQS